MSIPRVHLITLPVYAYFLRHPEGNLTSEEIGRLLEIPSGRVSTRVDHLRKKGYITRKNLIRGDGSEWKTYWVIGSTLTLLLEQLSTFKLTPPEYSPRKRGPGKKYQSQPM